MAAKRVSKQTQRFGAVSNESFGSDEEDFEAFDGDDSFIDNYFSPEEHKKNEFFIRRHRHRRQSK